MPGIRMTARCFPTEDRDRVVAAMKALFPDAVAEGDDPIVAKAGSVEAFAEQLAKQRIRSAARRILRRGVSGEETRFRLNKQVASLGKISFSEEEHALGDIEVVISARDVLALIDTIAPRPLEEEME
jgi:predicted RNA binding protein with dsRBD fold (UPF0201 family)